MIDTIKMSSKGQIVIPKEIRREMGIKKEDSLLVVSEDSKIILEKIEERKIRGEMLGLLDYFERKFREVRIRKEDIEKEVMAVRK